MLAGWSLPFPGSSSGLCFCQAAWHVWVPVSLSFTQVSWSYGVSQQFSLLLFTQGGKCLVNLVRFRDFLESLSEQPKHIGASLQDGKFHFSLEQPLTPRLRSELFPRVIGCILVESAVRFNL